MLCTTIAKGKLTPMRFRIDCPVLHAIYQKEEKYCIPLGITGRTGRTGRRPGRRKRNEIISLIDYPM